MFRKMRNRVSRTHERFELVRGDVEDRVDRFRYNTKSTVSENVRREKPVVLWSFLRTLSVVFALFGLIGLGLNLMSGFSNTALTTKILLPVMILGGCLLFVVSNRIVRDTRRALDMEEPHYDRHPITEDKMERKRNRTGVVGKFKRFTGASAPKDLDAIQREEELFRSITPVDKDQLS